MTRWIVFLLFLTFLFVPAAFAQGRGSIEGRVTDTKSNTPLEGANIVVKGTPFGAATDATGRYKIYNVSQGSYEVEVYYIGYESVTNSIDVIAGGTIRLDFDLSSTILQGGMVVVTANRAQDRETPVSFVNVGASRLKKAFTVQDVPHLFKDTPNIYVTSDGGSGMGDSNMYIRGFDMQRVQVMINNIPVNDPESKKVYWSNWGSLPAASQSIQVQRGVGSSMYGTGAFGGSVNVVTAESPAVRAAELSGTVGAYSTYKGGFAYNTGLLKDKYSFLFRGNYLTGNGWRASSYYEGFQYYFSMSNYMNDSHTLTFVLHGAPQEHAYTYYSFSPEDAVEYGRDLNLNPHVLDDDPGLTDEYEDGDGEVIGNGYISFDNNVFHKPQFELHHSWVLSDRTRVQSTMFFSRGRGYGENINKYYYLDLTDDGHYTMANIIDTAASGSGIYQYRAHSYHQQGGLLSTLSTKMGEHKLSFGGEFRYWNARHFGLITNTFEQDFSSYKIGGVSVDFRENDVYYDYTGKKPQITVFGHALWKLTDKMNVMTDAQYSSRHYNIIEDMPGNNNRPDPDGDYFIVQDLDGGNDDGYVNYNDTTWTLIDLEKDYSFFAPKLGINYNLNDQINVFANYSIAYNEPRVKYFYNYGQPSDELDTEESHDYELGGRFGTEDTEIKLNGYLMAFKNKAFRIEDPLMANEPGYDYKGRKYIPIGTARYQGVELSARQRITDWLNLRFSASGMDNHWTDDLKPSGLVELYKDDVDSTDYVDSDDSGDFTLDDEVVSDLPDKYGFKHEPGVPQVIMNAVLEVDKNDLFGSLRVGRFSEYWANLQNMPADLEAEEQGDDIVVTKTGRRLDPWTVLDLILGYRWDFGGMSGNAALHVNNVFDTEHTNVINEYGLLFGPERNIQLNIGVSLF